MPECLFEAKANEHNSAKEKKTKIETIPDSNPRHLFATMKPLASSLMSKVSNLPRALLCRSDKAIGSKFIKKG